MNVLGIIPARSGSKRVPNKNLACLAGKPMIAYTCEAALDSGVFAAVYVNTDSPAIAAVADQCGVPCPALRPAELARDDTSTWASNRFLLDFLAGRGERYDAVIVLQPTSPLRTAGDIRAALELYESHRPCMVLGVTRVGPAAWLGFVGKDGRFEPLDGVGASENGAARHVYRSNGAIYVHDYDDYFHDRRPPKTMVYCMPASRGVDVDTPEDFAHAEFLIEQREAVAHAAV